VQEVALRSTLKSVASPPSPYPTPARRSVGRWHHWLQERTLTFRFLLTRRFPDLGRIGDDTGFWLGVFDTLGLSRAMAWCDQAVSVP
jgi:hypothetical protein